MDKMYGKDVSPRKAMAMSTGEKFGVAGYPGTSHAANPDRSAGIGTAPHMADENRAVGKPVPNGGGMHPSQASPDHGPMHKSMDFDRSDSVA